MECDIEVADSSCGLTSHAALLYNVIYHDLLLLMLGCAALLWARMWCCFFVGILHAVHCCKLCCRLKIQKIVLSSSIAVTAELC